MPSVGGSRKSGSGGGRWDAGVNYDVTPWTDAFYANRQKYLRAAFIETTRMDREEAARLFDGYAKTGDFTGLILPSGVDNWYRQYLYKVLGQIPRK